MSCTADQSISKLFNIFIVLLCEFDSNSNNFNSNVYFSGYSTHNFHEFHCQVVTTETSDLNSCLQVTTSDITHKFKKIETFQTDVVMFSLNNKCALKIGKKKLPEYGAKQVEVCTF